MTAGHKHRTVVLDQTSWRYRLLQIRLARTRSGERAERSRFVWRADPNPEGFYELHLLGVLHALFGLTVAGKAEA